MERHYFRERAERKAPKQPVRPMVLGSKLFRVADSVKLIEQFPVTAPAGDRRFDNSVAVPEQPSADPDRLTASASQELYGGVAEGTKVRAGFASSVGVTSGSMYWKHRQQWKEQNQLRREAASRRQRVNALVPVLKAYSVDGITPGKRVADVTLSRHHPPSDPALMHHRHTLTAKHRAPSMRGFGTSTVRFQKKRDAVLKRRASQTATSVSAAPPNLVLTGKPTYQLPEARGGVRSSFFARFFDTHGLEDRRAGASDVRLDVGSHRTAHDPPSSHQARPLFPDVHGKDSAHHHHHHTPAPQTEAQTGVNRMPVAALESLDDGSLTLGVSQHSNKLLDSLTEYKSLLTDFLKRRKDVFTDHKAARTTTVSANSQDGDIASKFQHLSESLRLHHTRMEQLVSVFTHMDETLEYVEVLREEVASLKARSRELSTYSRHAERLLTARHDVEAVVKCRASPEEKSRMWAAVQEKYQRAVDRLKRTLQENNDELEAVSKAHEQVKAQVVSRRLKIVAEVKSDAQKQSVRVKSAVEKQQEFRRLMEAERDAIRVLEDDIAQLISETKVVQTSISQRCSEVMLQKRRWVSLVTERAETFMRVMQNDELKRRSSVARVRLIKNGVMALINRVKEILIGLKCSACLRSSGRLFILWPCGHSLCEKCLLAHGRVIHDNIDMVKQRRASLSMESGEDGKNVEVTNVLLRDDLERKGLHILTRHCAACARYQKLLKRHNPWVDMEAECARSPEQMVWSVEWVSLLQELLAENPLTTSVPDFNKEYIAHLNEPVNRLVDDLRRMKEELRVIHIRMHREYVRFQNHLSSCISLPHLHMYLGGFPSQYEMDVDSADDTVPASVQHLVTQLEQELKASQSASSSRPGSASDTGSAPLTGSPLVPRPHGKVDLGFVSPSRRASQGRSTDGGGNTPDVLTWDTADMVMPDGKLEVWLARYLQRAQSLLTRRPGSARRFWTGTRSRSPAASRPTSASSVRTGSGGRTRPGSAASSEGGRTEPLLFAMDGGEKACFTEPSQVFGGGKSGQTVRMRPERKTESKDDGPPVLQGGDVNAILNADGANDALIAGMRENDTEYGARMIANAPSHDQDVYANTQGGDEEVYEQMGDDVAVRNAVSVSVLDDLKKRLMFIKRQCEDGQQEDTTAKE